MASEGGHADFAPRNELEFGLWEFLSDLHGPHVSYERILSGNGFHDVFTYLRRTGKYAESPELAKRLAAENANPVISELGLSRACPLCAATLELFCEIYGAEAGNCALKCVGLGGVFIGGGIGPKLKSVMTGGRSCGASSTRGGSRTHEKHPGANEPRYPHAAVGGRELRATIGAAVARHSIRCATRLTRFGTSRPKRFGRGIDRNSIDLLTP